MRHFVTYSSVLFYCYVHYVYVFMRVHRPVYAPMSVGLCLYVLCMYSYFLLCGATDKSGPKAPSFEDTRSRTISHTHTHLI
jgi:hypothetical protein